jgi:transposase
MMGQQLRTHSLFYYLRLEDQIPEDHLLRLIDRHVDLSFVRERLRGFYSLTGRPSIDPEVLLRLLLVGYLYGITSERRLLDEVRMHLAYRWFTRLSFDQEIPDHSTFSKNRHGRFRQSGVFRKVFEEIVQRCLEAGLVEGQNLAVGRLAGLPTITSKCGFQFHKRHRNKSGYIRVSSRERSKPQRRSSCNALTAFSLVRTSGQASRRSTRLRSQSPEPAVLSRVTAIVR